MGTTERNQTFFSDMDELIDMLGTTMTPPQVQAWMHMNNPLLDGAKASDYLRDFRTEEVFVAVSTLLEALSGRFLDGPALTEGPEPGVA